MCHLIAISSFAWGINVGDIIRDGRDIYGDEVNVAARLEALAEPGGICVSRVVRDQVRDKLTFSFVQQVNDLYRETCLRHRRQPGRLMCSYFIHFADDVAQDGGAGAPDPLFPRMRAHGIAGRRPDGTALLPLFYRYGRAAAPTTAARPYGKLCTIRRPGANC